MPQDVPSPAKHRTGLRARLRALLGEPDGRWHRFGDILEAVRDTIPPENALVAFRALRKLDQGESLDQQIELGRRMVLSKTLQIINCKHDNEPYIMDRRYLFMGGMPQDANALRRNRGARSGRPPGSKSAVRTLWTRSTEPPRYVNRDGEVKRGAKSLIVDVLAGRGWVPFRALVAEVGAAITPERAYRRYHSRGARPVELEVAVAVGRARIVWDWLRTFEPGQVEYTDERHYLDRRLRLVR